MTELMNRQFYLKSRPAGVPTPEEVPFRELPVQEPGEGQVLLRNLYLSIDPAIRGWMGEEPNYAPPIELGAVVTSIVVSRVVKSNFDGLSEGDVVMGVGGWEDYSVADGIGLTPIDTASPVPLSYYLGLLGPTGMTAYFGLLDCGKPQAGETVLVSAAAGAVGSLVGQIAKIKGCRVVGMAGTEEKCRWIKEDLGFDAVINYKTCGDMTQAIAEACPQGVDVYFDNVGGEILDAALLNLNHSARIAFCGWISSYNDADKQGPKNLWQLLAKSATMKGFVVVDYAAQFGEGIAEIAQWLTEGKIQYREQVVEGLESALPSFLTLFDGTNEGKLIIKLEDE